MTVITLATVGFGDIAPQSIAGRCILFGCGIWGSFIVSLIVLVVANVFELNKEQKKAMRDIHVTRKATHSIALAIKFFISKKNYYRTMLKIKPQIYGTSLFV